jgi:CDP-6-deoxy-D-xylo-4-hexulose-3-dehydrase
MNHTSRESLDRWLTDNLEQPTAAGDYWYPLTLPTYGKEEVAAAIACMCDYKTSMGDLTRQFEREFADYVGAHDAIMVNSGSSADLLLAFHLVNPMNPRLQAGDEVLVPAVTWPTQVWSLMMAGLTVKLVDVDSETLNIDLDDLRRRITSRTKCVFAVHLMGHPCAMTELTEICEKHDLVLIEDCCESLGTHYDGKHVGNFGLGGSFSFFFSHHMTTMEGGMVICGNDEDAEAFRILRAHGWSRAMAPNCSGQEVDSRFRFVNWGFNVRPTELQAAFGIAQLKKLDAMNQRRAQLFARFDDYIDSTPYIKRISVPAKGTSSALALVVQLNGSAVNHRDDLVGLLEQSGIETRPVVTGNLSRQPAAKLLGDLNPLDYPGAEAIHDHSFYLGLNPMFDDDLFERMISTLEHSLNQVVGSSMVRKAG